MKLPIYMDYSATTPVDPRVAELMCSYLTLEGEFGNPASRSHSFGWHADDAVTRARQQVAELVNADPKEIVWTSGATESDNLAIKGVAHFYSKTGKHIVTCKTEHKAVLDTCRQLEREGFEVTYLDPETSGLIDLGKLESALRDDTILVSIMHVNNEIGVIQDIEAIGELTRGRKILLHVDAAQSVGKVPIDLDKLKVDLMSFSAHKIYGPKGIGALYVRRKPRVRLEAQMHGGGHERGMRSGTLATHQIVGMGEAFRLAGEEMAAENERVLGPAQAPVGRHQGHGGGLSQRRRGAAGGRQPECELRLRGRRILDHGAERSGGFIRFRLYLGQSGTQLCAACAGT